MKGEMIQSVECERPGKPAIIIPDNPSLIGTTIINPQKRIRCFVTCQVNGRLVPADIDPERVIRDQCVFKAIPKEQGVIPSQPNI